MVHMTRGYSGLLLIALLAVSSLQCKKKSNDPEPAKAFRFVTVNVNGVSSGFEYSMLGVQPTVKITFSDAIDNATIASAVSLTNSDQQQVEYVSSLESDNTILVVQPAADLEGFRRYNLTVSKNLKSVSAVELESPVSVTLSTGMDSTDKFARISDEELLTLVQQQTFKYFWDFGHPVSGLARERNTSGDIVTSGGSGFGIMAIVAAIHRGFITRAEGLQRLTTITTFLLNTAQTFHGAYPHWLNGATGEAVAFSEKDNGADLVETSYLIQGLLTARQYFDGTGDELQLRNDINAIWNRVEWDWFTNGGQDVLYWHWSPDYEWEMNMPIRGWNECLITYVLAASSTSHGIGKSVYDNGWARQGTMANRSSYYGIQLPLGPAFGGPLFFAHYSFLGINPHDLEDAYANYWTQNVNHTLINYQYCVDNPEGHAGYSSEVWGLTASDNNTGYSAHSPDNDLGVISPTAALSSFPYTPEQSMNALKFFYYKLGDKLWKEYGFVDAFNLNVPWFANSFLAIDQGPIIVMIENHRSGLLWDLFMSCPEVKTGMTGLGFTSPEL
jgi:hypothetical protein